MLRNRASFSHHNPFKESSIGNTNQRLCSRLSMGQLHCDGLYWRQPGGGQLDPY